MVRQVVPSRKSMAKWRMGAERGGEGRHRRRIGRAGVHAEHRVRGGRGVWVWGQDDHR